MWTFIIIIGITLAFTIFAGVLGNLPAEKELQKIIRKHERGQSEKERKAFVDQRYKEWRENNRSTDSRIAFEAGMYHHGIKD
jgi:hypothetical protein